MRNFDTTLDLCNNNITQITDARLEELEKLAALISKNLSINNNARVVFICTHNSRRSQLAEVWFRYACKINNIENISIYSAGTEATAFNERMVNALIDAGFKVNLVRADKNPKYNIYTRVIDNSSVLFSKTYDDSTIPQKEIIAVMVCDDAAENCPHIPNATHRIRLSYKDPKHSDKTMSEKEVYSKKVIEIGSEMLHLVTLLDKKVI